MQKFRQCRRERIEGCKRLGGWSNSSICIPSSVGTDMMNSEPRRQTLCAQTGCKAMGTPAGKAEDAGSGPEN